MGDADSDTPLAVDQRAFNCLDEAVRSISVIRTMCQLGDVEMIIRSSLSDFQVV